MTILEKIFKKRKDDETLENNLPSTIQTLPTTQPYQDNINIVLNENKKRTLTPKLRNSEKIETEILEVLRNSPNCVPTSFIASKVRISNTSCFTHLSKLRFDGLVESLLTGKNKRWCYWRIKR